VLAQRDALLFGAGDPTATRFARCISSR